MQIAVISLPFWGNYGHMLQAYAMKTVLERMGHSVTFIDRPKTFPHPWWHLPLSIAKRCYIRYILGNKAQVILEERRNRKDYLLMNSLILDFLYTRIVNVKNVEDFSRDIKQGDFDAYIMGSDQVWNADYFSFMFNTDFSNAFLAFTDQWNVKRIAYAASFGKEKWNHDTEITSRIKILLSHFDFISVRESSGVSICKDVLNSEACHVLDPTMLLHKEDYLVAVDKTKVDDKVSKDCVATYILDNSEANSTLARQVADIVGGDLMPINSKYEDPEAPIEERIQPSADSWLLGIANSKFIVTDSFHGTVFSILFNKPFVTIGNPKRGLTRIYSLLSMVGLEDRLFSDATDLTELVSASIDYDRVNRILEEKRTSDINKLKLALS